MATELSFHEVLKGAFAWGQTDPRTGALEGARTGLEFGFDGTIAMDDLDAFIHDPAHTAGFTGTYLGNLFESRGLARPTLESATFNFMAPGPGAPRLMIHDHVVRSGHERYTFHGTKYLEGDPLGCHTVGDLTTLYSTLKDSSGTVVAAGVLHFPMSLFANLVASFTSSGDDDPLTARMKFLKLFLHEEVYVLLSGFRATPVPRELRRKLARDPAARKPTYDVVVIGSGYGGGVAAARLAAWEKNGARKSVCVIERGRELRAGDFPSEPWQMAAELRTPMSPGGLFEYVDAGDIETVVGSGLGGTSLINAGVMLEADPRVFQEDIWPRGLPALAPYYARATAMIQPTPHPSPPVKARVLRDAVASVAQGTGEPAPRVDTVPIAVNFTSLRARADTGNVQDACIDCGACVTGCNATAKSTVDMTYLSVAEKAGAEIYVETEVLGLEKTDAGFFVHVYDHATGVEGAIAASQVVLAAGSLGTFRVLTTSARSHGLAVPPALGTRFTGNGDILGFGYDSASAAAPASGPTITTRVTYATDPDVSKHFILEDGGIPPALTALLRAALPFVKHTAAPAAGTLHELRDWMHAGADLVGLTGSGALIRSLVLFGMGTESTTGTLSLDGDALRVTWPGVGNQPFAQRIDDRMEALTFAAGGDYVKNPEPRSFLREKLITAHPLGGCPIGDDAATAVVNVKGEVFGHEGKLFVTDGSIIPIALGSNPALTIAALAEYIVEGISEAW